MFEPLDERPRCRGVNWRIHPRDNFEKKREQGVKTCGNESNWMAHGDTRRLKYCETNEPGGTGQELERDKIDVETN